MRSTNPPGSTGMRSKRSSPDRADSPATASVQVRLEEPSSRHGARFLEAVRRSRSLHGRWAHPPATADAYRAFLRRVRMPAHLCHFVRIDDGLAGVINITEVVRGPFGSGYLGYYALAPHNGRGYMRAGLEAVIRRAFTRYRLHRLEANIQPD